MLAILFRQAQFLLSGRIIAMVMVMVGTMMMVVMMMFRIRRHNVLQ
jgi:hypothetical protein